MGYKNSLQLMIQARNMIFKILREKKVTVYLKKYNN